MDIKIQSIKNQVLFDRYNKLLNQVNPAKKEQKLKKEEDNKKERKDLESSVDKDKRKIDIVV